MPTYRIGIGSEFNLKDRKVGIGSESPIGDLDITGIIQSGDLYSSGISTLTTYSGFSASNKDTDSITIGYNDRQIYTMSVTNNGTDHYTFSNATDRKGVVTGGDPDITINVGDTLKITNTVGATHPLWINHTQGTGNGNGVSDVIGNGDARNSAVVTWIPTESGVYYYNCQHHANMTGRITVQAVSFDRNYSTELDIVVGVGETFTVLSGTTLNVGSISDVTVENTFGFPVGDRPEVPIEGTVRFNRDLNTLEFYNGVEWRQFTVNGASGRAVWMCGMTPSYTDSIGFINIQTKGNEQLGGVSVHGNSINHAGCASRTRGVWAGEQSPSGYTGDIDYITMASVGNSIDFGNLSQARATYGGSFSSSTRGVWAGGYNNSLSPSSSVNTMDYVEIATTGNALDFGDMKQKQFNHTSSSSPTRGFVFSGSLGDKNEIQMSTIASKGETMQEVGVTAINTSSMAACSNSVRAVIFGGGGPITDMIQSFDMTSLGNTILFGDLSAVKMLGAAVADSTRAVSVSGRNPSTVNIIEYVEIASGGSAIDFGDMSLGDGRQKFMGASDSHGGLGGF